MVVFAWIIWSLIAFFIVCTLIVVTSRLIKYVKYSVGFSIQFQWLPTLITILSFIFLSIYLFA